MADLWSGFIRLVQHPRDHYRVQQMSSVLSKEESEAISLESNADIFPGMSKQLSKFKVVLPTGGTYVSDFLLSECNKVYIGVSPLDAVLQLSI